MGDSLSPLQFVIAMMPHNYILGSSKETTNLQNH